MVAFVSNLSAIKHSIDMAKARIEHTVTEQIRGVVTMMLKDLAMNTPQWSGDLAASWQVVVGKGVSPIHLGDTPFKQRPYKRPSPHEKGDPEAVGFALMQNQGEIASIRWNSTISIQNVNPTEAVINETNLRPDNFIRGDIMAVKYVAQKYRDKNLKNTRFDYGRA